MDFMTTKREIRVLNTPSSLHYLIYKTPYSPSGFAIETRWGAGSYHSHCDAQGCLDFWAKHQTPLTREMSAQAQAFMSGDAEAGKPDPFATVADEWQRRA